MDLTLGKHCCYATKIAICSGSCACKKYTSGFEWQSMGKDALVNNL